MAGVKICGLSTPETVSAALDGGASHVGLNFFPRSPRYVDPEAAARLAPPARGRAVIVAVTVDPDDALVDRLMATLKPDLIQLHGGETPQRAAAIRARAGVGVIKVIPVSQSADIARADAFDGLAEHLMFEGKPPPEATMPGGVGAKFDWSLLAGRRYRRPHFLAGGLNPWNVQEALDQSGAPLADVSSGVERGAGIKDPGLITAFLEAVRRA
jgi:phosphoribosylanthranilate isomerase